MFGFDPLVIPTYLMLAAVPSAVDLCPDHDPTRINVTPRTADVTYDYSQSLKQIQGYATDTVDPYSFHGTTVTQGFMKGSIGLRHKIWLKQASIPQYKAACVWYDKIEVELFIEPTVVLAKELYKYPCMRKAIIDHELKHVRVDREIVNKFSASMGQKLMEGLKSRGFTVGPFPIERLQEISGKMQTVVKQILELEYQKLSVERQEAQRAVDNLEEYESVNAKCPDFEREKEKLYIQWLK